MRTLLCLVLFAFSKTGEGQDVVDFEGYERQARIQAGYPPHHDEPVPFGHITIEGFGDPFSPLKQPADELEMHLRTPKNEEEAIEELEKTPRSNFLFLNQKLAAHYRRTNPKEELVLERFINPPPETNETMLKWYDLPTIQARNAMLPPKKQYIPRKKVGPGPAPVIPQRMSLPSFVRNSFQLANDRPEMPFNWTSCDEFVVGAVFFPKDIVNLKWTPFYVWQIDAEIDVSTEHTFEYPSNKLVMEYHAKFNKYLNKTVDWTNAKLLMKGLAETLLIAADKRGLFHSIVKHKIPEGLGDDATMPSPTLRMKIEDPYLVLTYCENRFAMLMAVSGNEPTEIKEMETEAATIKFKGPGKPIWRDLQLEKEIVIAEHEAKRKAEKDKFLVVDQDIPPIGQWD